MNTAEVVDKYASQIADAVRQVAPQVWDAAWKQAVGGYIINAMCLGIPTVAAICVAVLCRRHALRLRKRLPDARDTYKAEQEITGYDFGTGAAVVVAVGLGMGSLGNLLCIYYSAPMVAIQLVAGLAKP